MLAVESRQAVESLQKCGMSINLVMVSPSNLDAYKHLLFIHGCHDDAQVEKHVQAYRDLRNLYRNHQDEFKLQVVSSDFHDCYKQAKKLIEDAIADPFLLKSQRKDSKFFVKSRKRRKSSAVTEN